MIMLMIMVIGPLKHKQLAGSESGYCKHEVAQDRQKVLQKCGLIS